MPDKKLEEIAESILRDQEKQTPIAKSSIEGKTTQTPFGAVYSKLYVLNHSKPLRKGEILAYWITNKQTKAKQTFCWLGVVESCWYSPVNTCWKISYRSFVDRFEKEKERLAQLNTKQLF